MINNENLNDERPESEYELFLSLKTDIDVDVNKYLKTLTLRKLEKLDWTFDAERLKADYALYASHPSVDYSLTDFIRHLTFDELAGYDNYVHTSNPTNEISKIDFTSNVPEQRLADALSDPLGYSFEYATSFCKVLWEYDQLDLKRHTKDVMERFFVETAVTCNGPFFYNQCDMEAVMAWCAEDMKNEA